MVAWAAFASCQWFAAPGRIEARLRDAMAKKPYIGRIAVNLDFTPEEFHINYLQRYGVVAGVDGRRIFLVQVPVDQLWRMAELYWIRSVQLAE